MVAIICKTRQILIFRRFLFQCNILSEFPFPPPLTDRQSPIYQITQESALPLTSTRFFTKDLFIKKIKHFIAQFFFKENKSYIFPFRVSCTALSHMVVNFTTALCWTCLQRHQTSTLDLSMENQKKAGTPSSIPLLFLHLFGLQFGKLHKRWLRSSLSNKFSPSIS